MGEPGVTSGPIPPQSLQGPAAFLREIAAGVVQDGIGCIPIPDSPPEWLLPSIREAIEATATVRAFSINASKGLKGRSPAHMLASAVMPGATAIRSVAALIGEAELADAAFVVSGIPMGEWPQWATFLRAFKAEWARADRPNLPLVAFCPPSSVGAHDLARFCRPGGEPLAWRGRVERIDTEQAAFAYFGKPDGQDLASSVATSVAVELAGWDLQVLEFLATEKVEERLDPTTFLEGIASQLPAEVPSWARGTVDGWDGMPFVHTLSLLRTGERAAVDDRIWKGQVRVLFPFLQRVRAIVVGHYKACLVSKLPREKVFPGGTTRIYRDPFRLEFWDIIDILGGVASSKELGFLKICHKVRTALAHMDVVAPQFTTGLSNWWRVNAGLYAHECPGWDWPRSGQKLTVLIGPSGAGKSTWAAANHQPDEIVSSDAIRTELGMPLANQGDQSPVFAELRRRVAARLSSGRSAVIDATNLRAEDRLSNVSMVPGDMPVEYVVLDRPMSDKQATAGWRDGVPGLLERHATQFTSGIAAVLDGDNLANVAVRDMRDEP